MSFYSDIFREKEKTDNDLAKVAEGVLVGNNLGAMDQDRVKETEKALAVVLERFGLQMRESRNCRKVEDLLDAVLDPESIMYEKIQVRETELTDRSNIVLAYLEDNTPILLYKTFTGYHYYDVMAQKPRKLGKDKELQDEGYMIHRSLKKGNFSLLSFLKLMLLFIMPRDIPLLLISGALATALGMVAPQISKMVLTEVVPMTDHEEIISTLISFGIVFLTAGLFNGLVTAVKGYILDDIKIRISNKMQVAVMSKLLLLPYDYFQSKPVGKLSNQVRQGKKLAENIVDIFFNNLLTVCFAFAYIGQMSTLAPHLVVPAVLALLLQVVLSVIICFISADNTELAMEREQNADGFMFEMVKGIQKIFSVGAQKRAFAKMAEHYGRVLESKLNPPAMVKMSSTLTTYASSLGSLIVLLFAAASKTGKADYIAFTTSFALIAAAVTSLASINNAVISTRPILRQLKELFEGDESYASGTEFVDKLKGEIELRDLSFSYKKGARGCVDHIDLTIKPGEKIAFVGESGCGKSTLLKLMMGMIEPDYGTVLYDGTSLGSLNQRSLRKRIGSVLQFSRTFPDTIYANIAFTSGEISIEEAWEAAEKAAIADDIKRLQEGMDTVMLEGNGGGFSGGQKQRILLARVFAQKPAVMILDEATSALDNVSQGRVLKSIYASDSTVVMVAHRLSTVIECDRIIMLRDGSIVEMGKYDELMALDGEFAELVRKQQC